MLLLALLAGAFPAALRADDVIINRALLGMFQPLPESAENPNNPFSDTKVDLGRMLYYDKRLSADRSVSCASCHNLNDFGDDGAPVSTGIGGNIDVDVLARLLAVRR